MYFHNEHVWTTVVSIHIDAPALSESELDAARDDVVEFLHYVDRVFSTFIPTSAISQLRTGAVTEDHILDSAAADPMYADVADVTRLCRRALIASQGAYDAWAAPGGFDPSGLVKGWAAERSLEILRRHGIVRALVNAGGDIATMSDDMPWSVGISDPDDRMEAVAAVDVTTFAVCTSGTYERGEHLVDPRAGGTSRGARAATVVGPNAALADAFATAICVDGLAAIDWFRDLGPEWSLFLVPATAPGEPVSRQGFRFGPAFAQAPVTQG